MAVQRAQLALGGEQAQLLGHEEQNTPGGAISRHRALRTSWPQTAVSRRRAVCDHGASDDT